MVNKIHYRWDFIGLSTDTKPTPAESPKVVNGSTYYESDTSKLFVFYKDTWYERKPLGGGGGGGTEYTAGDGIDITNDVISVDTDTIQPKLTAGANISIVNDTISATDTTYSDFTGTDGSSAGSAGLVPAPAVTDAGKFLKADGTWDTVGGGSSYSAGDGIDITNDIISATNTGKAKVLTTADYNWPVNNPTRVALWLLDAGTYTVTDSNVDVRISSDSSGLAEGALATVSATDSTTNRKAIIVSLAGTDPVRKSIINLSTGATVGTAKNLITTVQNTLTSTETGNALSAAQGKVLNEKIGGDLSNLTTTDKSNLIAAINEVADQGGGVTELTSADYNYPTDNPTSVALWMLPTGMYTWDSSTSVYGALGVNFTGSNGSATVLSGPSYAMIYNNTSTGAEYALKVQKNNGATSQGNKGILTTWNIYDNLDSVVNNRALSANQGRVLKELIDALDVRVAALEGN